MNNIIQFPTQTETKTEKRSMPTTRISEILKENEGKSGDCYKDYDNSVRQINKECKKSGFRKPHLSEILGVLGLIDGERYSDAM